MARSDAGGLYTGPFHVALRTAIRRRGLTLDRLRAHLARRGISVSLASLSDWQNGHSRPAQASSLLAVRALEDILGLPPRSMVRLLDGGERARMADIGPVAELLDTIPGAADNDVELVSAQHKVVIGAGGHTTSLWTRTLVRALRDGVDRYLVRYYGNPGCDPALVRPEPLGNCRLGRVRTHPAAPAMVYELTFGQTLRAGDTWVFESRLVDRTGVVCTEFAYGFRYPADQFLLEVRFHPDARPARCSSFAQYDLADDRHVSDDLVLSKHNTVHLAASAVPSGVLGIQWDWA